MDIVSWIVTGLIIGLLSRFFIPGKNIESIIVTIVLGIGGGLIGGYLGREMGYETESGVDFNNILMASFGAIATLIVFRLLKRI